MLDWDKLRIFHTVAKTRNITRASEELYLSQSAVSRQITSLEEQLKTSLFHRRPRGLLLTDQGEILMKTVTDIFQKLSATENALTELGEKPKGTLRLSVPIAFGTIWLVPMIREFRAQYPEIELDLILDDKELDLSMREADLAIRFQPTKHLNLVQKRLFTIGSSIYAGKDYLEQKGIPKSLDDLSAHTLIAYTESAHQPFDAVNWLFEHAQTTHLKLEPAARINSLYAILRAVKSDVGIAALPDYMVKSARRVVRILPGIRGPEIDAYLIYPEDLKTSRRIRAFSQFLSAKLAEAAL